MESTGTFILVRHGESQSNRDRHFALNGDVGLTETGRHQAEEVTGQIAAGFAPARVLSSHFRRAMESAEIIARRLDLPLEVVEGIHERDLGCLKGQPWTRHRELAESDPSYDPQQDWLWRPQGGESYQDVQRRVVPRLEELRRRFTNGESVIVSHGAVMRAVFSHFSGSWDHSFIPQNCAILLLPFDSKGFHRPNVLCSTPSEGV